LVRFHDIMDKLVVYPERMKRNIAGTHGLMFSQRVMLALASRGLSRERAYEIVQKSAMEAWRKEKDLAGLLWKNREVRSRLSREEFRELFDGKQYLRFIDDIFDRVF
ncbi:MAG: adenylosuccinate lyase, partial [Deltaproteobacteria bacterium]|nr:adenylosuccinate lyase [Deltaproteobacteria bacterium]